MTSPSRCEARPAVGAEGDLDGGTEVAVTAEMDVVSMSVDA